MARTGVTRQFFRISGRSNDRRTARFAVYFLVACVVAALATITALAYASPPDPTWIPGVYDDGDFDDVVSAIADMDAAVGGPVPIGSTDDALSTYPVIGVPIVRAVTVFHPPNRAGPPPASLPIFSIQAARCAVFAAARFHERALPVFASCFK
jgi:hypothetical protein